MWNELMARLTVAVAHAKDEEGQTLVEYSLIIALVSVALILALGALAGDIGGIFGEIGAALDGAIP